MKNLSTPLIAVLLILSLAGYSQNVSLLKDVNSTPSLQSAPEQEIQLNSQLLFAKDDGVSGKELWVTNGTPGNERVLKDINPGAAGCDPRIAKVLNGELYFLANDGINGQELWKTNGTSAGTVMVKDIWPGAGGGAQFLHFEVLGNELFFTGDNGMTGTELFKTDGTQAGTVMVTEIRPGSQNSGPQNLTAFNGRVYFIAQSISEGPTVWASDGTAAGTVQIKDPVPGSGFTNYAPFMVSGGILYFSAENTLWKSDGSTAGTVPVGTFSGRPISLTDLNGILLFTLNSSTIWRTDGTGAGTFQISFLNSVYGIQRPFIGDFGPDLKIGNEVYYFARQGSPTGLYKSDGTAAGTVLVRSIPMNFDSQITMGIAGNKIYFAITTNSVIQNGGLWRSDGTTAGTLLIDHVSDLTKPDIRYFADFNGQICFSAMDTPHGGQVWTADPITGRASPVTNMRTMTNAGFSSATRFVDLNGVMIFTADDGASGLEPWRSDGTPAGTFRITELRPGSENGFANSSFPNDLTRLGNDVIFSAAIGANNSVEDRELWKTDGTEAGTVLLKDIKPGTGFNGSSRPTNLTRVGSRIFFSANDGTNGTELWVTDGTTAGTQLVKNIHPFADSNPRDLKAVGSTLFFVADDGVNGQELWKSDGTAAGTSLTVNINPTNQSFAQHISYMTEYNGQLYFSAQGANGIELYTSDGTEAGTVLVKDIFPGAGHGFPSNLIVSNGKLMFNAEDGVRGRELWTSDGTEANTILVKDIRTGPASSNSTIIGSINNKLIVFANDGIRGMGFWQSDGTTAGTHLMSNLSSFSSAGPTFLSGLVANNMLFFSFFDNVHGSELWHSNGTAEGTGIVVELASGSKSTIIGGSGGVFEAAASGSNLFFVADNGVTGKELWKYQITTIPPCQELLWYADPDGDGISNPNVTMIACSQPPGYVAAKQNQTITFNALSQRTFGDEPFDLAATASSGLTVEYLSSNLAVASVSGATVTINGAGTTVITASQPGDAGYNAAPPVQQTLMVIADEDRDGIEDATDNCPLVSNPDQADTDEDGIGDTCDCPAGFLNDGQGGCIDINECSTGEAVCAVNKTCVNTLGSYVCVCVNDQDGDGVCDEEDNCVATANADQTDADQDGYGAVCDFNDLDATKYPGAPCNDGNACTLGEVYDNNGVCFSPLYADDGTTCGSGQCQQGVCMLEQTIDFASLAPRTYGDAVFVLDATSTSGLDVSFTSSNPDVVTVDGPTVTIHGAGESLITAKQGGNAGYMSAPNVSQVLVVNKASLQAAADDKTKPYGSANPVLTLTYSGFTGTDDEGDIDVPPIATTTATQASAPGTYPITLAAGSDTNYDIAVSDGVLTITGVQPNVYVITPADGESGVEVQPKVTAIKVPGASIYTIQISNHEDFSSGVIELSGLRTQTFNLTYGTTYYCRVSTNLNPAFGPTTMFSTIGAETLAFVVKPVDGAVDVKVSNVKVNSNIVPGATSYTIELNTAPAFNGTSLVQTGGRQQVFPLLTGSTRYYTRVKTEFTNVWGAVGSFTTKATAGPGARTAAPETTGGEELLEIKLLGNPIVQELKFRVESALDEEVLIQLHDINGRALMQSTEKTNTVIVKNVNSANGVYILRAQTKLGVRFKRVVKVD